MSNKILVFTMDGCGHCKSLKNRLEENSIPYMDIEITDNQHIWNQVVEQTGHSLLPTIFIKKEDSDDGPVFIPGRDYQSEDEIVKIIKNQIKKG